MEKITLTVKEVANVLGVSENTVYTMCRMGEIPHARVRGKILFVKQVVEEWLTKGGTTQEEIEKVL